MRKLLPVLVSLLLSIPSYAQQYIKPTATGSGLGTSWDNARGGGAGLDAAIALATATYATTPSNAIIYLAAGTYLPQVAQYNFTGRNNLTMKIQGGFPAGNTGTDVSNYNPITNITTLDAGYSATTKTGRQFYFDSQSNLNLTLRGMQFTNKQGAGDGYWLRGTTLSGNCTVQLYDLSYHDNCQVTNSTGDGAVRFASLGGAGNTTTFLARNCYFINNQALNGAAFGFSSVTGNCRLTLDGCLFNGNRATATGAANAIISSCNQAAGDNPANITIRNSVFCGNQSQGTSDEGGGALYLTTTKVKIDNCRFSNNTALGNGNPGGAPNGGAIFGTTTTTQISNCKFVGNRATAGGAIFLRSDVVAPTADGFNTSHIDNCDFYGNNIINQSTGAAEGGGAVYLYNKAAITVDNCRFTNNYVPTGSIGGAVRAYLVGGATANSVFSMQNPVFYNNYIGNSSNTTAAGADYSRYDATGSAASLSGGQMQRAQGTTTSVAGGYSSSNYVVQVGTAPSAIFATSPATLFGNTTDPGLTSSYPCPTSIAYLSGAVRLDPDGQSSNTGPGTNLGGALYATLTDASGVVINSVPVGSDGSYIFTSDVTLYNTYKIVLTNGAAAVGSTVTTASLPGTSALAPNGWVFTADYDSPTSPSSDGIVTITPQVGQGNINFGVDRVPATSSQTTTIRAPRQGQVVPLDGQGSNPPVVAGSDPEDLPTPNSPLTVLSIIVLAVPANGELYSGTTLLTNGAVVSSPATLRFRATGSGYFSTSFRYATIDRAGVQSNVPGTYTLNWTATPFADLSATLTSSPASGGTVAAGTLVPYTVTAANDPGASYGLSYGAANNTVTTVQLQPGLTGTTLTVPGATAGTPSGGSITYTGGSYDGATYNQNTGLLTFPAANLAPGESQSYSFAAAAPANGPYTVVASVSNGTPDPVPGNNTASATLNVSPRFDVGTTIAGPAANPTAGNPVSYVVTAGNYGSLPATGVAQLVAIGQGQQQVFVTGGGYYNAGSSAVAGNFVNGLFVASTGGSLSVPAGTVALPPQDLAAGQVVNNTITFAAPASGTTLAPASTFTSATLANDTNTANNAATAAQVTTQAATGTAATPGAVPTGTVTNLRNTLTATSGGNSVAPGAVMSGIAISYTATTVNDGPDAAQNVRETVSIPADLAASALAVAGSTGSSSALNATGQTIITYAGGPNAGATYNTSTGVLSFPTVGALASQGSRSYDFSLTPPASATQVSVVAEACTSTTDPALGDNVAQALTKVRQPVDVSILLVGPATGVAGQPVTYASFMTNNSAAPAQQVRQILTLPAGLLTSTTNSGGLKLDGQLPGSLAAGTGVATFADGSTYDPRSGVLTLPALASLPGNQTVQHTLTYLAPATEALVLNTATFSSTTPDSAPGNNASALTTNMQPASDVVAALSGPATATVGNTVTYAIATTNNGPSATTAANPTGVGATLPAGLPLATSGQTLRVNGVAPASVANGVATYPDGSTYTSSTGVLTLPSVAGQQPGAVGTVVNTVTFEAPGGSTLTVAGRATPTAATNDRNADNNVASTTTTLSAATGPTANVAVTVSNNGPVSAGRQLTFSITPSNALASAVPASNVQTQVVVAAGLPTSGANAVRINGDFPSSVNASTGVATYPDDSTYDPATGLVQFPVIASLAAGTSDSPATVSFAAPGTASTQAVASVSASNPDSSPANNVASSTALITANTDLSTTVSGPAQAAAGSPVAYTITTTNQVPAARSAAGGSLVTDAVQVVSIPAGMGPASASGFSIGGPGAGAATISGSQAGGYTISIPVGAVSPGQVYAVSNVVSFNTAATAPAANPATVSSTASSSTADPTASNNTGSTQTAIVPGAPVAQDIVNNGRAGTNAGQAPLGSTAGPMPITSLTATALGSNTIASYTLVALPTAGTLYSNGVAVTTLPTGGRSLSLAEAALLSYDPAGSGAQGTTSPGSLMAGNSFFTFTATDNAGTVSNQARYTIPVNQDEQAVYTVNEAKGGATIYANGDELARAYDYNGGQATTSAAFTPNSPTGSSNGSLANVPDNGVRRAVENSLAVVSAPSGSPTSLAALGLALDPATGSITVVDRTKLREGTYRVNLTTTDEYSGVTTQDVTFRIGAKPLPVQLTTFAVRASGSSALLSWATASELNNSYFEVERSLNAVSFTSIGRKAGQGSTATSTSYAFTDQGIGASVPAGQPVYYRLRQVDLNGTATFSPVRLVRFAGTAAVTLFPNPAAASTTLDLSALPATGTYQVLLLDATGRQLHQLALPGGRQHPLDLHGLASGTYLLLLSGQQADGTVLHQVLRLTKE